MKTLNKLIADILNVEESVINDDSSPDNIATWDSFNGLMMVSELEKNFNISLSMEEAIDIKNVLDIKLALKRHNVVL